MSTIETDIWMALRQMVKSIPGGYQIAYPGQDFSPPNNAPYVYVQNLINRPIRIGVSPVGPHELRGILQLNLHYPVNMKHAFEVMQEKAGLIAAFFPVDHELVFGDARVRIYEKPHVMQPIREDADWIWSISIRWQLYT